MPKKKSLEKLKSEIQDLLIPGGCRGAYGNNIVMMILRTIDRNYGKGAATKVMKELKLNQHGWSYPDS